MKIRTFTGVDESSLCLIGSLVDGALIFDETGLRKRKYLGLKVIAHYSYVEDFLDVFSYYFQQEK